MKKEHKKGESWRKGFQTNLIKGLVEEMDGMKKKSSKEFLKAKDMKSAHDFFNGEQYALQKVIDLLNNEIKK